MTPLLQNQTANIEQTPSMEEPARRLADLQSARAHLARTVLSFLAGCVNTDSICDPSAHITPNTQRLLSAAIRDLVAIDDQLDEARNPLTTPFPERVQ
ncbi:hypothetical protein H4V95_001744 [Arthrobacter sp. CAN_C5]|nr:hypothetical protein [Arthrobacter sp. CAN_C5]